MGGLTPYQVALSWIEKNPGTSGAAGLAKLTSRSGTRSARTLSASASAASTMTSPHFPCGSSSILPSMEKNEELVRTGYRVTSSVRDCGTPAKPC
jgi:hypothetical protein